MVPGLHKQKRFTSVLIATKACKTQGEAGYVRMPANKADAALCWCVTPIAGIPWPEQWVRASSATGHCRLEPNGRVAAGVTVVGCLAQSAVAGGYQTFDINVWATCPTGQVHAGTPAP